MDKKEEIKNLAAEIRSQLSKLESVFWEAYVEPTYNDEQYVSIDSYPNYEEEDKKTWLFHGTRILYYKICLFFRVKRCPSLYENVYVKV